MQSSQRLRIAGHLLSAGADGYPEWYFDVPRVTCSRGPTARPVAEFAMASIFAHAKQMPQVCIAQAADWRPRSLRTLHGATLGVGGSDAIGLNGSHYGPGAGHECAGHRRSSSELPGGILAVSLDELLAQSDHFVLVAAATADTSHRTT